MSSYTNYSISIKDICHSDTSRVLCSLFEAEIFFTYYLTYNNTFILTIKIIDKISASITPD